MLAFARQLMKTIPDTTVMPYIHASNKYAPFLKRMFYEKFKAKIFTAEELSKIADKEQNIDRVILEVDEILTSSPPQSPPPIA